MPLGIVSDKDFEAEVSNSATVVHHVVRTPEVLEPLSEAPVVTSDVLIKKHHPHGRNEGDVNVPQSLRKLIGDTVLTEGRTSALHLANELGISNSSVSNYTNPTSLSEPVADDINTYLTNRKTKISKRALNKLNLAMTYIDESKLKDLGARDLSAVAKDMAVVAKHMEPPTKEETEKSPVQFHFYAPQVRNENHYEVVTAKDNY